MNAMLNCGHCGRFVVPGQEDWYAPWGGAADQDPPDPVVMCPSCVKVEYDRLLARLLREGIGPYDARPYYGPPVWWFRARSVARGMFAHGHPRPVRHQRVRHEMSGQRMVWWCACGRPEKHPRHDRDEARRLSLRWHPFEKRHGRNISTVKVQEWCACGWATGPLVPGDTRQVDYLMMGGLLRAHIAEADPLRHHRAEVAA